MSDAIRILCVDDEQNVLDGLKRQLRKRFDVTVAISGAVGLATMKEHGPFAVIVSDMRMPEMNGAEFLKQARALAPDTVRILLTGQSDLNDAVSAVNDGKIFRFLQKPCPAEHLTMALEDAAEQHRLVTAEKVLLEQTLFGSIQALTEILSLSNPTAFGRATRTKRVMLELMQFMERECPWYIEVAAMLSQIGSVTLPADVAEKLYHGQNLTPAEEDMALRLPRVGEKLIGSIPRLDEVRDILRYQNKNFDGTGYPKDDLSGEKIPIGARLLKIVLDYDMLETQGLDTATALDTMRSRAAHYDDEVLDAFVRFHGGGEKTIEVREIKMSEVEVGMVFVEDVLTDAGLLVIARGQEITLRLVDRIRSFSAKTVIREPVRVQMPDEQHVLTPS